MAAAVALRTGCFPVLFMFCACVAFEKVPIDVPGSVSAGCLTIETSPPTVMTPSLPTNRNPEVSPEPLTKFTLRQRLNAGWATVFG